MVDKTRRFHRQLIHNQQNRIALFKETKKKEMKQSFRNWFQEWKKFLLPLKALLKAVNDIYTIGAE